jgi:hypothetical protein
MADILQLRTTMRAANAALAADQAQLDVFIQELDNAVGEVPPPLLAFLRHQVLTQQQVVRKATTAFNNAQAAYQAAVLADPMHQADAGVPLALLPIRIETAYLPSTSVAGGIDLVVRVYPDDIHVDTHEPELTSAELAAGTTYWRAVWGAGANQTRLDAAWAIILGQLKPLRAAWAVRALMPSAPRPAEETPVDQAQPDPPLPDVATRPGTFNRPARTTLLPDHWHVVGFRGDQELFNVDGLPIPDTLDLSFGPPGTGAPASDLPFDAGSRWLVDLDAAIAAGMAIRIPLAGPDLSVSQLFVLGVLSSITPDEASARLEAALIAHQFTNGLAFLPPGTPTNNTPKTRSSWEAAPQPPSPAEVENARAGYQSGSNQNAALAAKALGVDGSDVLCIAPDALTDQQFAVATIMRHLWPAIGDKALSLLDTTWDIPAGGSPSQGTWKLHADLNTAQALEDHALGWVRSRGTLPVVRVGNQPYGLLPALSLDDWAINAGDPTAILVTWLRTFRQYWLAAAASAPAVIAGSDPNADSTVVNVLGRLPVSVDVNVRVDGDPASQAFSNQPLPPAQIPGLPTNSELFLSFPATAVKPIGVKVISDAAGDQGVLKNFQGLFNDGILVMQQDPSMTPDMYKAKYKTLLASKATFPGAPPPDLFISMLQDAFTDPLLQNNLNAAGSIAGFIICAAFLFDPSKPDFLASVATNLPLAKAFAAEFDTLCTVDPAFYETGLREALDVFSHRLDAWITSLAARRLDALRAAKPSGLVIGAYGWVEDLAPRTDLTAVATPPAGFDSVFSSPKQKYIHAPSLHHAATAAVLRAGYDSHAHPDALAVNLVSSRVRIANWLAEGVRNGQTVGALLGYRFERGLHDAVLDVFIASLRSSFPQPLPAGPDADVNGGPARTSIVARNVVDGLALYRSRDSVLATLAADPTVAGNLDAAASATIGALLKDLVNTVDAFGDLLLAESVHHLVGGNPLRAGLAADTVGRGEPVPDRFDVVTTPRSGRALTWQIGALLPADFVSAAAGWNTGRPRAVVEPHVNAWVATMLGNASSWQIVCSVTTDAGVSTQTITLDALGLCALDVVAESSGDPSQLEMRVVESVSASQPAGAAIAVVRDPSADGSAGFGELLSLAQRIRIALGKAIAVGPQQLQGANASPTDGLDMGELDGRVAALEASFSAAVQALGDATQSLSSAAGSDAGTVLTAVQSVRSALIGLADHGVPAAWPSAPADSTQQTVDTLGAQAGSVLAAVQGLNAEVRPTVPDASANSSRVSAWITAVTQYAQSITGAGVPIAPVFRLAPDSDYAAAFAPGAAPAGADASAVMAWLRRVARIRPGSAALHDIVLAVEALQSAAAGLSTAQLPAAAGAPWVGLPFTGVTPPAARLAHVFSTPAPIDPTAPFCGFLCDTFTEQVPGLTTIATGARKYEPAEVTGMAFTVDAPDAYAPQSILLAIAPDQTQGWSLDILLDTVRETLDLAKIRTVDLGDLPRLGRVFPVIHSGFNVDQLILGAGGNA